MVFAHLARHWLARRHYPFASWAACVARSLRVLLFHRAHLELLALAVYRDHIARVHDDVFHHLSHRHYLAKGLTLRERVRCVLTHYRFEGTRFDSAYRQAVYRDGGLLLWQHDADGARIALKLHMAQRPNAEGDLTVTLLADGACLHCLSFSWVDAQFAGAAAPGTKAGANPNKSANPDPPALVPFIARNQGHHAAAAEALAAFGRAFPHNSPAFFCFAALQGIAGALGMEQVVAVKSAWHGAAAPSDDAHFANAYDGFWRVLGGAASPGRGWRIALPFYVKPLAAMPCKHRKRAAQRRAHWRAIGASAGATVLRHTTAPVAVPAVPVSVTKHAGAVPEEARQ